ncbi:MAG: ABC transporter substrate-binding protein [Mesorhizobium amorphae]|nr:MAG: ABC transporter substrate-binding protein [Mesorhizobium amorphae]
MTWSHPRGFDPMVAGAAEWERKTGISVTWEKRSLQDFESYPVEELARAYDLIVIDHPHVGQITDEGCLLPLDVPGRESERAALAKGSVGPSYPSYTWRGHQWAFPLDAATQVQAYRKDRLAAPLSDYDQVLTLGREGHLALPLRSPHALMVLYSLAANMGTPCATQGPELIGREAGTRVWTLMRAMAELVDPVDFESDPIAVFERMAEARSPIHAVPLIYGYVPYATQGFRERAIAFADVPAVAGGGPRGAALGGTGIAVSARTAHPREATDFAYWIASGPVQRTLYAASNGQPGHAEAWEDAGVNAATGDFYRATRATLEGSFLRPRHDGYMAFQAAASDRIVEGLRKREEAGPVLDDCNRLFAESFK